MKSIVFLLATVLSLSTVHASSQEELSPQKSSKLFIPLNALSDENQKKAELNYLTTGLCYFFKQDNVNALEQFREAISVNGSPLGYLYAAVLEPHKETPNRYLKIVSNAVQADAISLEELNPHISLLVKRGFLKK